jgi:membrane fusion protein (multidrug efflux system)
MSNKSVSTGPTPAFTFTNRLPLFILVAILAVLIIYLQWPEAEQEESKFQRVVAVKMVPVALTEFIESIEAVGTARANEQVNITSKYSDLVDEIYFDDGQKVKKRGCAS